jgi:NSS family neurotransmitter:Na+ symporter
MENVKHEKWSSGFVFLLAAVGSAVGLGNIWRFPYVVAENGGGAFVLMYLAIVILLGIPLLMTELSIGRRTGKAPLNAFKQMAKDDNIKGKPFWTVLGWSYMFVPLGILCFYFVVAGWTLNYLTGMIMGDYNGITAEQAPAKFGEMLASPKTLIFWMTITLFITIGIVSRGIAHVVE